MNNDGSVVIGTELDTKSFDEQIKQTEEKLERLNKSYQKALNPAKGQTTSEKALKSLRLQIEQTENKLIDLRRRQVQLNEVQTSDGLSNMLANITSKTKGLITQTMKWGLALFGIRSVYGMLSSSASTLSQYNKQIGVDMQYIRFALATTLQPIIEYLIKLAYKLLSLINGIAQALFGVNLFANAGVDNFNKMGSALGGANKSAKELKKQLAGFDEMNVLQETPSGSGASGGGGIGDFTPQMDLSKIGEESEKIAKKVKETIKGVSDFWENDWESALEVVDGNWDMAWAGLVLLGKGAYDTFKGAVEIISGVFDFLKALVKGDMEGIEESLEKIWEGVTDFALGIVEMISGVFIALLGAVAGILLDIWDGIKEFFNFIKLLFQQWLGDTKDSLKKFGDKIKTGIQAIKDSFKKLKDDTIGFFTSIGSKAVEIWNKIKDNAKSMVSNIRNSFSELGTKVGDFIGKGISTIINSILNFAEQKINGFLKSVNKGISAINKIPGVQISEIKMVSFPRLAKGGIINMPGRGVPVGSAIGGERGQEGVIPLTDSQQMALLGEAIGRYITINANITNTMNGRVISRELQKINNESDFAYNR